MEGKVTKKKRGCPLSVVFMVFCKVKFMLIILLEHKAVSK